jgi:hypothetical protein
MDAPLVDQIATGWDALLAKAATATVDQCCGGCGDAVENLRPPEVVHDRGIPWHRDCRRLGIAARADARDRASHA